MSLLASSALPLLILALLSVEKIPQGSSFAFHNNNHNRLHSDVQKRKRIRTTSNNFGDTIETITTITSDWQSKRYSPRDCGSKGRGTRLWMGGDSDNNNNNFFNKNIDDDDDFDEDDIFRDREEVDLDDKEYLKRELARLESMEKMLEDIEEYCSVEGMCEDDEDDSMDSDDGVGVGVGDGEMFFMGDVDELEDMESLFDFLEEEMGGVKDIGNDKDDFDDELNEQEEKITTASDKAAAAVASATVASAATNPLGTNAAFSPQGLEEALLQGVVPVDAGVGSDTLPGDFGFDPLGFAERDYVQNFQYRFLDALPGGNPDNDPPPAPRPSALVLRDYREAEIRHGRLAMLAVLIWPIQEKLDQFFLDPDARGPLLYGPITLPYLPLFMTLIMMLLGYLDIYAKDIQEEEGLGDAFLPGDCFWDPLRVLDGAPATMKRNMQERELFNGRVAMLAFAAFVFEEATSHQAVVDIPANEFLFVPAYQIPSIQEWLDAQFLTYDT